MVTAIIGVYTLYVLIRIYVSVMQIGYVNQAKRQSAVLMTAADDDAGFCDLYGVDEFWYQLD
jgi:hypothetical protein